MQFSGPFYSDRGVFIDSQGRDFEGWYCILADGQIIEGSNPYNSTTKLFDKSEDLVKGIETPDYSTYIPSPSEKDYQNGKFTRYYIQNISTKVIREVSGEDFLKSISDDLYISTTISWCLVDIDNKNQYIAENAADKNLKAAKVADKTIPGISTYIIDFNQFN